MMNWLETIIESFKTRKVYKQVIDKKDRKVLQVRVTSIWWKNKNGFNFKSKRTNFRLFSKKSKNK